MKQDPVASFVAMKLWVKSRKLGDSAGIVHDYLSTKLLVHQTTIEDVYND